MRIAAALSYNGYLFSGFQYQNEQQNTVQRAVQTALSQIAQADIELVAAGRTDSGVHASHQVIHFDTPVERPLKAWVEGVNTHLPRSVRVHWAQIITDDFHARFSALSRRYRYVIAPTQHLSATADKLVTRYPYYLDASLMDQAARYLIGDHDFSSFRAAGCQSQSVHRYVFDCRVYTAHRLIVVDITANAFLYHMVRNIVGCLLDIGQARRKPEWLLELLAAKDRTLAAATAPADGLYLVDVLYPDQFELPITEIGPWFCPT